MTGKDRRIVLLAVLVLAAVFAAAVLAGSVPAGGSAAEDPKCCNDTGSSAAWRYIWVQGPGFENRVLTVPVMYYHSGNGTWSFQDESVVNRPVYLGTLDRDYDAAAPYPDRNYTPDLVIAGTGLSMDFLVSNRAGEDIAEIPYTIETRLAPRNGVHDWSYLGPDKAIDVQHGTIWNLSRGEYREIRITTVLSVPGTNETLNYLVAFIPDEAVKTTGGEVLVLSTQSEGNTRFFIESPETAEQDNRSRMQDPRLIEAAQVPGRAAAEKEVVRTFTGDPDATVVFVRSDSFPMGNYDVFNTARGEFRVNSDTGVLESAYFLQSGPAPDNVNLTMEEAEAIARSFAEQHYPGFPLPGMERSGADLLDHGDAGKEYVFTWQQVVNGTETPNRVYISVNPATGEVRTYMAVRRGIQVSLVPEIAEEEAIRRATAQFPEIAVTGVSAKLQVGYGTNQEQRLVWLVEIHGEPVNSIMQGGLVGVDAMTGEITAVSRYL